LPAGDLVSVGKTLLALCSASKNRYVCFDLQPAIQRRPLYANNFHMLVLHVAYVSGADVAVDHEHDQVGQLPGHFNALDQAVSRRELASRFAKV
jgi:hypothetical protein